MATPIDFIRFLIDCGGRPSNREARQVAEYFHRLLLRERVVTLTVGKELQAFCTFFLLPRGQRLSKFHYRKPWTVPPDLSTGPVAYMDLVVARLWNKKIRRQLEEILVARFPQIEEAVWYRVIEDGPPDRECRYTVQKEQLYAYDV